MNLLYTRDANGTVDEVGQRLEAAVKAHQFGVIDLKGKMQEKGVEFGPACRIYEVCNPHRAKEVLETEMSISTALPCRISVYEEEGKTKVATLLLTATLKMFDTEALKTVVADVERHKGYDRRSYVV